MLLVPPLDAMMMKLTSVKPHTSVVSHVMAASTIDLSQIELHHHLHHHIPPLTSPLSCASEGGADGVRATPQRHDDEIDLGKASHVGS